MNKITVKDLRKITGAELVNVDLLKRRGIIGVSTDSRSLKKDNIFFALKGEKHDAHDYIDDAVKAQVSAVVVHRDWATTHSQYFRTFPCVFIVVDDTTKAYGELARIYRRKFEIPIIAIAGSNGKTTTKDMVSEVLRAKYDVLNTEGNLNNHIGVPQTLFRLTRKHGTAVIEIGTNHFGELEYLCGIAEPTHGLITNIGKEHLEFFGDEVGVAKEEKALFNYLEKNSGTAFVNSDDEFLADDGKAMKHSICYGTTAKADVQARKIQMNALGQPKFDIVWQKKKVAFTVKLSVPGMHNVVNALAASTVGLKLNVRPEKIAGALGKFSAVPKRMEVLVHNDITILNDTYNSNPDSVIVALKTLQSFKAEGKKIVVLGDMKELGDSSKREHTNIGVVTAEMNFDRLLTYGSFSKYTSEAFGTTARHFESKEELSDELKQSLTAGDIVLIKGSRGMKMEDVVNRLTNNGQRGIKDYH